MPCGTQFPLGRDMRRHPLVRVRSGHLSGWRGNMTSTTAARTDVPNNVLSHRKPPLAETYPRDLQPRSASTRSEVLMLPRNDVSPPASNMIDFPLQERLLNAREVAARL